jgi:hypothetical protein
MRVVDDVCQYLLGWPVTMSSLGLGALSALSLSATPLSTSPPCDLSSSPSSYLTPANSIFQCLDIADVNLSALGRLQSIDLSSCASNLNICQTEIQTEISEHPNSVFAQLVAKLISTPELTCPCLSNAAFSFGSCLPLFNNLASYCEMLQDNASAASLASAGAEVSGCSQVLKNICPASSSGTDFQQMMSCLESHVTELEGKCSAPLNAMLANVYSDCEHDLSLHCSSGYVLTCLQDNFESLSQQCQAQVQGYVSSGAEYPCLEESKLLCPSLSEPEEVLQCLSEYLDSKHKKLSQSCQRIVLGFQTCSAEEASAGAGSGADGEPTPPADDAKGPPGEEGNGESKPAPGDKSPPQRKLQKSKPSPKPKPGPSEKPCWARGPDDGPAGGDPELNDGTDLLTNDPLSGPSDSASSRSSVALESVMVSLGVLGVGFLAVFSYQQHRRALDDEENLPTVKGYWRAPSIQASLYDDSTHSEGAVVYGEGLEMEKVSERSASSFRPHSPSEVQI